MKNKGIIKDQEYFFNVNADKDHKPVLDAFVHNYVNKEQELCFKWIENEQNILDYGCGTGLSIDIFLKNRSPKNYNIYGVDIAAKAIEKAKRDYPQYHFYKINDNKVPQIKDGSMDAAYMIHVLHHAIGHQEIFNTISSKLKKGGKFFLNDLTSDNPFIRMGRKLFLFVPPSIQEQFSDDLVVDGNIPDKYKIDVPVVVEQLEKAGFKIEEVGRGHLFFFLVLWVDKLVPLSKVPPVRFCYSQLIKLEQYLMKYTFFKKRAEVVYIRCIKK